MFSSIEIECKEIMDKVTKRIRENMTNKNVRKLIIALLYILHFNLFFFIGNWIRDNRLYGIINFIERTSTATCQRIFRTVKFIS